MSKGLAVVTWNGLGKLARNSCISCGVEMGHRSGSGNSEQYITLRPLLVDSLVKPHAYTSQLLNPPHARIKGIERTMLSIITTFKTKRRFGVRDSKVSASWYDFVPSW